MLTLEHLPVEILEYFVQYVPVSSTSALLLSCKRLYGVIHIDKRRVEVVQSITLPLHNRALACLDLIYPALHTVPDIFRVYSMIYLHHPDLILPLRDCMLQRGMSCLVDWVHYMQVDRSCTDRHNIVCKPEQLWSRQSLDTLLLDQTLLKKLLKQLTLYGTVSLVYSITVAYPNETLILKRIFDTVQSVSSRGMLQGDPVLHNGMYTNHPQLQELYSMPVPDTSTLFSPKQLALLPYWRLKTSIALWSRQSDLVPSAARYWNSLVISHYSSLERQKMQPEDGQQQEMESKDSCCTDGLEEDVNLSMELQDLEEDIAWLSMDDCIAARTRLQAQSSLWTTSLMEI